MYAEREIIYTRKNNQILKGHPHLSKKEKKKITSQVGTYLSRSSSGDSHVVFIIDVNIHTFAY